MFLTLMSPEGEMMRDLNSRSSFFRAARGPAELPQIHVWPERVAAWQSPLMTAPSFAQDFVVVKPLWLIRQFLVLIPNFYRFPLALNAAPACRGLCPGRSLHPVQWIFNAAVASAQLCASQEPVLFPGGMVVPTSVPPEFWSLPSAFIINCLGDFE